MGFDLAKLKAAISKAGQLKAIVDPIRVESHLPELEEALQAVHAVFGDGFQWSDVPTFIGTVVPEFMDVARAFKEETGEEKKQFVVDAVVATYFYYNPNLPWIPEPFETALEKWVVPKLAEAAIEAAYRLGAKRGWWSQTPDDAPTAEVVTETSGEAENTEAPADSADTPAKDE